MITQTQIFYLKLNVILISAIKASRTPQSHQKFNYSTYFASVYSDKLDRSFRKRRCNLLPFVSEVQHTLVELKGTLYTTEFTRPQNRELNITSTIESSILFDPIKVPIVRKSLRNLSIPNHKIGTMDIATYMVNGIPKVYAIAFHTRQHGTKTYYSHPATLDSDKLVMDCIDAMLKPTYADFVFYVHNFGGFEAVFILKTLIDANIMAAEHPYKYKIAIISRVSRVLSVTLSRANSRNTIKLVDSYSILTPSLEGLFKDPASLVENDIAPHSFITNATLFYQGDKPSRSHYLDISAEKYDEIPTCAAGG